jgi:hypothetical protein
MQFITPYLGGNVPTEHLDWPFVDPLPEELEDASRDGGMRLEDIVFGVALATTTYYTLLGEKVYG